MAEVDKLATIERDIVEAREDLRSAKNRGNEALELEYCVILKLLLKDQERLIAG
jgi:hypothetical protein